MLEKTLESPLDCKEIKPVNPKGNQYWIFIGRTDAEAHVLATWCKELTQWKKPWCWERLKAGGEGDDRGWDGWMASPTQWTWVWASSRSWWWTGKPGMLQSMGSQKVRHDWVTEKKWMKPLESKFFKNHLLVPLIWPGRIHTPGKALARWNVNQYFMHLVTVVHWGLGNPADVGVD